MALRLNDQRATRSHFRATRRSSSSGHLPWPLPAKQEAWMRSMSCCISRPLGGRHAHQLAAAQRPQQLHHHEAVDLGRHVEDIRSTQRPRARTASPVYGERQQQDNQNRTTADRGVQQAAIVRIEQFGRRHYRLALADRRHRLGQIDQIHLHVGLVGDLRLDLRLGKPQLDSPRRVEDFRGIEDHVQ